jgi:hypothetical protein
VNRRRILSGRGQQPFQRVIGESSAFFENVFQHQDGSIATLRMARHAEAVDGNLRCAANSDSLVACGSVTDGIHKHQTNWEKT